jgi:hypothetical protein
MKKTCRRRSTTRRVSSDVQAFVWERGVGTRPLLEVLRRNFAIELPGWKLTQAFGISDDGTTIVGSGTNPTGQQEAFAIYLDAPRDKVLQRAK